MIRVSTGWRLHALVAESGRRASLRSWSSARTVPVQVRASAPYLACWIGVRTPLVWGCCPGRHRGQAPCRCGAAVSASPCQGEGREFESRHLLARGCSSAGRARHSQCRGRRLEAGQPLACRPSPIGRGAGLRNLAIGVRVPGTVLRESEPIRDRDRFEGGSAFWRWGSCPPLSARGRCAAGAAAGLEPSRRVTPWGSTPPSSSRWPRPIRS